MRPRQSGRRNAGMAGVALEWPANPPLYGTRSTGRENCQKAHVAGAPLLEDFTDPGDLILDSHAGSGTTGAACIELGRRNVGFELTRSTTPSRRSGCRKRTRQEQMFKPQKQEQRRLAL